MVAVLGTIVIPGRLSLGTMSLDAIEKKQSLQQHVTLGISSTCGDIMSYDACRYHSGYELPSGTKVLYGIVREYNYPLGIISALAPPQFESEPQLVMDRRLRECFKGKRFTE